MAIVIGICGGSGSGKTTLSNILNEKYKNISFISYDSYYKDLSYLPREKRDEKNYDEPCALDEELFIKQIKELSKGETINKPIYDFLTHTRNKKTKIIVSNDIIIVEGILIFSNRKLRDLFDIKIFLEADGDTRLSRRIIRDCNERNRTIYSVIKQYFDTVKPMHEKYVEPKKRYCDIIIPNDINININKKSIDIIELYIDNCLLNRKEK